ncbi:hypothetical protein [Frigoriflavimonas asaccharolytica]|uniref:Uncharacterized protein n=1 Tax=Frigoriflavimonas asaccharolytica TaxID=2735899 RepID=A0A8J8GBJ1_9FLAO|nr:hypothetical protein [Frigoriflavimonas asaccharolytica]NRS93507.1 hypothetical protein [Frigoriflavimonas asaccharolytica]
MKSIKLLIILLLFIGCKSEKEWNKEELEIVTFYINEKLFRDVLSPDINKEFIEIYEKDSANYNTLQKYMELDSIVTKEVSKRKFYITISDFDVPPYLKF